MLDSSVIELAEKVVRGQVTARSLAEQALSSMTERAGLNAFVHTSSKTVLHQADLLDERRRRGEVLGALAGVPIAIKDAICTADFPTTCASRILLRQSGTPPDETSGWQPPFDATVIAKLRAADAIVVGKTHMDEFAMGSSNESSAFGPALNPWDPARIPGGSSGGSAVAVAAGLTPIALGSDTGGSIRQPAGLCGVVGLKPSYGRVSRYGLVAYASSLDQIGPFSRDVRGAARVLSVIAGADARDATCAELPVPDFERACERDTNTLRLGVPAEYFGDGLDPDIRKSVEETIEFYRGAGCQIVPVSLPHTRYGVATYYILATAEASSNLARFDGVRFGLRVEPPRSDLSTLYGATRDAGFGNEVKRRILLGTYVLSAGYYDAYYRKAQQARTLIVRDFERAFQTVDAIITPTSPTPAFRLGEKSDDPLAMYLEDVYTLPCNLAGLCGMSLPARMTPVTNVRPALPVGFQLLAPPFQEQTLFTLGAAWERSLGGFPRAPRTYEGTAE
ncbi:MAG TPA: Asp-tRNA(Asn)/Glu-tRNA(Gln) amidotransferase subunit GatA [Polyangiaceae bacterium]